MLDLSRMLGRYERFGGSEQSFMDALPEGWQDMRRGQLMNAGIRDLLQGIRRDWRTRFRDRFGGEKRHNDPSPVPVEAEAEPMMEQGDPYGNPFTPTPVALGSMLSRRPIT